MSGAGPTHRKGPDVYERGSIEAKTDHAAPHSTARVIACVNTSKAVAHGPKLARLGGQIRTNTKETNG